MIFAVPFRVKSKSCGDRHAFTNNRIVKRRTHNYTIRVVLGGKKLLLQPSGNYEP